MNSNAKPNCHGLWFPNILDLNFYTSLNIASAFQNVQCRNLYDYCFLQTWTWTIWMSQYEQYNYQTI